MNSLRGSHYRILLVLLGSFLVFGLLPGTQAAPAVPATPNATFEVDIFYSDGVDTNPGDGKCLVSPSGCTLRAAIQEANALSGAQLIIFDGASVLIYLASPLPPINDPTGGLTIQGENIQLFKGSVHSSPAIEISSDDNRIHGMIFSGFSTGVKINSGAERNFIGTNGDGFDDTIEGNEFYDSTAYTQLQTQEYGVHILGNNNTVAGNLIGLSSSVSSKGKVYGVYVEGNSNLIGTNGNGVSDTYERNIISGNLFAGVVIDGGLNRVAGNYIGLNAAGTAAVPNGVQEGGYGIQVINDNNIIGTNSDGSGDYLEGNVISGNKGIGLGFSIAAYGNRVAGNYIGTDSTGTYAIGNTFVGIILSGYATDNLIGTNADGVSDVYELNLISGNGIDGTITNPGGGIAIGDHSDGNVVAGNYIGTSASGNQEIPNKGFGIRIYTGANYNLVGTNGDGTRDSIERNLISGNDKEGVIIESDSQTNAFSDNTHHNAIAGNWIGIKASGTAALPNHDGVVVRAGAENNRIGSDDDGLYDSAEGNVISGNTNFGVFLTDDGGTGLLSSNYTDVFDNKIGVNANGVLIPNGSHGVYILNSVSNNIFNNLIAGNADGIRLQDSGSSSTYNHLESNTIRNNTGAGIYVLGDNTQSYFYANSVYDNGGLGIDIYPLGPNANDYRDFDTGPNNLQNYPDLTSATILGDSQYGGVNVQVAGTLNFKPSEEYRIMIFASPSCDPSGYGEGRHMVGTFTIEVGSPNPQSFHTTITNTSGFNFITAVAIDKDFNYKGFSEFSKCVEAKYRIYLPSVIR